MGLFFKKKEKEVIINKDSEPEGRANIAKQIRDSQIRIQKSANNSEGHDDVELNPPGNQLPADNSPVRAPKAGLKLDRDPDQKAQRLRYIAQDKKYNNKVAGTTTTAKPQDKPFYHFSTRLKPYGKKGRGWYIGIAIFFGAVIAFNIYLTYYMSAIVLLLLVTLLFVSARQANPLIKVSFYTNGLKLSDKFYPWSEFKNFWILYEPPGLKQLHLKRRSKIIGELTIELLDEHPLKIRDLLLQLLPEDATKEEHNIDFLSRTFKL